MKNIILMLYEFIGSALLFWFWLSNPKLMMNVAYFSFVGVFMITGVYYIWLKNKLEVKQ